MFSGRGYTIHGREKVARDLWPVMFDDRFSLTNLSHLNFCVLMVYGFSA
jgi:hypothetical protein